MKRFNSDMIPGTGCVVIWIRPYPTHGEICFESWLCVRSAKREEREMRTIGCLVYPVDSNGSILLQRLDEHRYHPMRGGALNAIYKQLQEFVSRELAGLIEAEFDGETITVKALSNTLLMSPDSDEVESFPLPIVGNSETPVPELVPRSA